MTTVSVVLETDSVHAFDNLTITDCLWALRKMGPCRKSRLTTSAWCRSGLTLPALLVALLAALHVGSPPVDAMQSTAVGYLEGKVTVGPLRPAQRVDAPVAPVPAEVYAAYPIKIFESDGVTWVADVNVGADGTYRIALMPDTYVVALARTGIRDGRGGDLPKRITVASGQTVRLDIDIDTGMR